MAFFAIIFVLILGLGIGNWYLNEKSPEVQVKAILKQKKRISRMDANNVMYDDYYLIFDVNGELKKFKVNYTIYKQYNENEKGTLLFKRKRFVNFVLDK